jgi:GDP-4-dehydro-6-deoxy-D-mannose reductase
VAGVPLVTGATGFAGSHLLECLLELEPRVAGWSNPHGQPQTKIDPRLRWQAVDLLDRAAVVRAIAELQPAAVYHCGGVADVGGAWEHPERALEVNVVGTHHLLDAIRLAGLNCPVLVTGSALVYRQSSGRLDENAPIAPASPYGLSKLAQEMLAARTPDFPVLLARPFNHAGPRQSDAYVTSSFAKQIAEIEAGVTAPVLRVGNLEARRDITDVRDVVRAYRLLMLRGTPWRPYNVCSGRAYRIADLLDLLVTLSDAHVRIDVDPARLRASDNPLVLGDRRRIGDEIGWTPEIAIEQTLRDLLEYWRHRTTASS